MSLKRNKLEKRFKKTFKINALFFMVILCSIFLISNSCSRHRLFYLLFQITRDQEWMDWVEMGAKAIMESGVPEQEVEGFWNNVGVCCGSAGVADFFSVSMA